MVCFGPCALLQSMARMPQFWARIKALRSFAGFIGIDLCRCNHIAALYVLDASCDSHKQRNLGMQKADRFFCLQRRSYTAHTNLCHRHVPSAMLPGKGALVVNRARLVNDLLWFLEEAEDSLAFHRQSRENDHLALR